jgi:alpha-ketoglutarate-dependent 2,4-dichlorophenoxyacetate dioxygenase
MSLSIRPLTASGFAGEVSGVDLTQPLSREQIQAIDDGMDQYGVLVFHEQRFTDETQMAFSRQFGELEVSSAAELYNKANERRLPQMEMADVSNLDTAGKLRTASDRMRLTALGNRLWHSDASFRAIPAKYSLLSARTVPGDGGNTEFADMRAAYDALDENSKAEIAELITEHSNAYSREQIGFLKTDYGAENQAKLKPVRHRLVRFDPRTGRKSLYLSAHIGEILGWPVPEGRMLIRDLTEHAVQRKFVYAHAWKQWDLVIWDNRTTMHRARRYNDLQDVRDMRRTTIRGEGVTVAQVQQAA